MVRDKDRTKLTPLKLFVINFQSILAKRTILSNLIHDHHPDIMFGTETWLSPEINTSAFFLTDYIVFRQDRQDGYGGVLLAVRNHRQMKLLKVRWANLLN